MQSCPLTQKKLKTGMVIERSRDVTPRSKVEEFPELWHFEKNDTRHLFRSAAILKVLVGPNWFSNLSEPWVKESRHANFGAIQAIFLQLSWSQHKLAHSCQGRRPRSNRAINRTKHFFRSFCRGISNLVTPSLTVAELFQKEGMKWQRESEREREREREGGEVRNSV